MRTLVALVLVLVACGHPESEGTPDGGGTTAPDAGDVRDCTTTVLCFPGCEDADPTCLKGVLDAAACACKAADGTSMPMPRDTGSGTDVALSELVFAPSPPERVARGDTFTFGLRATYSNGVTKDVSGAAQITFSPSSAVERTADGWHTLAAADLAIDASLAWNGATKTASAHVKVTQEEARAIWVTRFAYSNANDVKRIVNAAADAHFNVVMFQIRGTGDAFYHSNLEPWAQALSGTLGKDPGWDPLQVAIDTAHARGIELHAYFNVFAGYSSGTPPASPAGQPDHVLHTHPEWVEKDQGGTTVVDGYQWLAPGIEAVRAWNTNVARDLLTHYAVDGLHLDRIRYSGRGMGFNALEQQAFEASGSHDFDAWRVEQVNAQVKALYDVLREVRPNARLSAAVWGIHTVLPGCGTSAGKRDYFQDSWAWTQGGYIDALAPMIYWAEGSGCTDYGDLLATFMQHKADRQIWAGMHVLDKDSSCGGNCKLNWPALSTRVDTVRLQHAEGMTLFASSYMDPQAATSSQDVWKLFADGPFVEPADVPARRP